jgi:hypothetical protein
MVFVQHGLGRTARIQEKPRQDSEIPGHDTELAAPKYKP